MRKDKHCVNSLYASCKKIGYDHCGQGWGLKAFTPFESENDTRTADVMSRDRYRRPQDRRGPREDLCDHQDWPDVDQAQYAVFDAGWDPRMGGRG